MSMPPAEIAAKVFCDVNSFLAARAASAVLGSRAGYRCHKWLAVNHDPRTECADQSQRRADPHDPAKAGDKGFADGALQNCGAGLVKLRRQGDSGQFGGLCLQGGGNITGHLQRGQLVGQAGAEGPGHDHAKDGNGQQRRGSGHRIVDA